MATKKRKKNTRQRGSRTHGWGLVHRNSGQRGGAGNAGHGKKAHAKKPSNWKNKSNPKYLGKHGFISKSRTINDVTITIKDLEEKLPRWLTEKKALDNKGTYEINLTHLGYTKLLSTGKATKKFAITIANAVKNSVEKIKNAGGTIHTSTPQPKT